MSSTEAAILAGILKAPSRLAPHINPADAWDRAKLVLEAMAEVGALTPEAADRFAERPPAIRKSGIGNHVRFFTDWAATRAATLVPGVETRSIIIHTTLDPAMQRAAADALSRGLETEGADRGAHEGAVIALDHDGAVRAMVGGSRYGRSQFNRAVSARRQPGSAFKLFAYLAALERGLEPEDKYVDSAISIDGWAPRNFTGQFYGKMTAREAFARSINTVAVQIAEDTGRERVRDMAKRMGIQTPVDPVASLPLGTEEVSLVDLTSAYSVVASGGFAADAYTITEITSLEGEVLYRRRPKGTFAVISRPVVEKAADMLTAVVAWGLVKQQELTARQRAKPEPAKTAATQYLSASPVISRLAFGLAMMTIPP